MTKAVKHEPGLYWHVHHLLLLEHCWNYAERVASIRATKPEGEIETRLRLLQPVQGPLPRSLGQASDAYEKADAAGYFKANDTLDKAINQTMPALLALHEKECGCGWTAERGIAFAPLSDEKRRE